MYLDVVKLIRSNPHLFIFGKTGAGKGTLGASIIEELYEAGFKVVSIQCLGDMEHLFKRFPAEGQFKKLVMKRGDIPRGYPVEAYIPVCEGYLPEKLFPFGHLYTVPVVDEAVSAELLSVISMTGLTDIARDAINSLLRVNLPKGADLVDLYFGIDALMHDFEFRGLPFEIMKEVSKPSTHRTIYIPTKYLFMGSAEHKLALTSDKFVDILNKQEEISVFVQAFAPRELRPFFSLLPLEYIFKNAARCKHPILIVATEIQSILGNLEEKRSRNPAMELFNTRMVDLVRGGRKYDIHFVGDSQIFSDISPKFLSQAYKLAMHYEVESEREYKILGKKRRWMKLEDLNNELLFLKHNPQAGVFEFFSFDTQRRYLVRLPKAALPYEGNKSDFMRYVERMDGKEGWYETAPICKGLAEIIVASARAKRDILAGKKDEAAEGFMEKMRDEERETTQPQALQRNEELIDGLNKVYDEEFSDI